MVALQQAGAPNPLYLSDGALAQDGCRTTLLCDSRRTARHCDSTYNCESNGSSVVFLISVTAICECNSRMEGLAVSVLRTKDS